MTQSPASDAEESHEVSEVRVDSTSPVEDEEPRRVHDDTELSGLKTLPKTAGPRSLEHVEEQEQGREETAPKLSRLEKRRDSDPKTTTAAEPQEQMELEEEDTTKVSGLETWRDSERKTEEFEIDGGDRRVPDEVEEEALEGRLSTDTSEQIFIGQQIEARAGSDQCGQADEAGFHEEQLAATVAKTQHAAATIDLLDLTSSDTADRLQSPDKMTAGNRQHQTSSPSANLSPHAVTNALVRHGAVESVCRICGRTCISNDVM